MNDVKSGYKKKLIEVAIPLDIINEASKIKGFQTKIHLWWARRPIATCQAVIFCSLIDDPSNNLPADKANKERKRLFKLISKFIEGDNSKLIMCQIQEEIKKSCDNSLPVLYDPFSGGSTIPLAGQTLGLNSYGGDLNPVAVILGKCLVELPHLVDIPYAINSESQKLNFSNTTKQITLSKDLLFYGEMLNNLTKQELIPFYPNTKKGFEIMYYLFSRTITCPNPACSIKTPLIKNWTISQKKNDEYQIVPIIEKGFVHYYLKKGISKLDGTIGRTGAKCVSCGTAIPLKYIKNEAKNERLYNQLIAIVAKNGKQKKYLENNEVNSENLDNINLEWVPELKISFNPQYLPTPNYGMKTFGDLFTKRQLLLLNKFIENLSKVRSNIELDYLKLDNNKIKAKKYADIVITYLALIIDKIAENNNSLCRWRSDSQRTEGLFARQAIPMVWDFSEINPFLKDEDLFIHYLKGVVETIKNLPDVDGKIFNLDASHAFGIDTKDIIISTDPPYFDNIGYSDLSDFFYVWLRKSLSKIYPDIFATLNTPKSQEIVANKYRFNGDKKKAENHFYQGMLKTFSLCYDRQNELYPLTIHYAFKQSEVSNKNDGSSISSTGWETMLSGLLNSNFQIVGTWPIRTETGGRMRSINSNSLASSIVIVCRKKNKAAQISTRRDFINALKKELPYSLKNLQEAGISPVDMAQSAIGPGMAVFSRYSKVLESDGTAMSVRTALQIINQELDVYFSEQESDMDKETRFCNAWYEQFGWKEGPYGDANTLATAKGTAVNALEQAGVISAKAGKVKLLKRSELNVNWDPTTDKKLTIWECVQYLIKALEEKGEIGAAEILKKIGGLSDPVKELAYSLYALCEKKGWSEDGLAYNKLISSWQSIMDKSQFDVSISAEIKKNIKDKSQRTLKDLY